MGILFPTRFDDAVAVIPVNDGAESDGAPCYQLRRFNGVFGRFRRVARLRRLGRVWRACIV